MDLDAEESIDFDFFDEHPQNKNEDVRPSSASASASKPPLHPHTKSLYKTDNTVNNDTIIGDSQSPGTPAGSDTSRDSSPEHSGESVSSVDNHSKFVDKHRGNVKTQKSDSESVSSASSTRSSFSSTSLLSTSEASNSNSKSRKSDMAKKRSSQSKSESESEDRPTNPIAKSQKQTYHEKGKYQQKKDPHSSSSYSDSDDSKTEKSFRHCDDKGDFNQASGKMNKKQAWDEVKVVRNKKKPNNAKSKETLTQGRPKSAKQNRSTSSYKTQTASSHSYSDSDITDVSPIDSSRSDSWEKHIDQREESSRMTSAGDGHHFRKLFRPITDDDHKDSVNNQADDPDKITGLDLKLLIKAVGELEKQNRVQANSRRVMFAPATLKNMEKANYTFDKNQTRDIERENHRLLKEIVRHVNSGHQRTHSYRPPNSYRLTPSAVNRERDVQRIERENLALLKRLQEVKPTKSICRDHQLRTYESTVYLGVPIAALHHKHKGRRMHNRAISDSDSSIGRARSVSSITSVGSSVRSVGSSQSSRASSASRQTVSSTRQFDSRPAWSDRW